jgi:hypothetical protein
VTSEENPLTDVLTTTARISVSGAGGVFNFILQCANETHTFTVETYSSTGEGRAIPFEVLNFPARALRALPLPPGDLRYRDIQTRIDNEPAGGSQIAPDTYSNVVTFGRILGSIPKTRFVVGNIFPDDIVTVPFSGLSSADREILTPLPVGGVDLGAIERSLVVKALTQARHNKTRTQLYSRIEKYGLVETEPS